MALILQTEVLGYTQTAAYRLVRPKSRATDESAASYVRQLKRHYRENYPLSINEAIEVLGITIEDVAAYIKAEMKCDEDAEELEASDVGGDRPARLPDYVGTRANNS